MVNLCKYIKHEDGNITTATLLQTIAECITLIFCIGIFSLVLGLSGIGIMLMLGMTPNYYLALPIGGIVIGTIIGVFAIADKFKIANEVSFSLLLIAGVFFILTKTLLELGIGMLIVCGIWILDYSYSQISKRCNFNFLHKTIYTCKNKKSR